LHRVERISNDAVHPRLRSGEIEFLVACDVTNPLLGDLGATAVFGPQKGLKTAEQRRILEDGLLKCVQLEFMVM
jgi:glycerate kinase